MDASTESGKMQLRVYLGAILNRPENVFVFRNVAFNGIRKLPIEEYLVSATSAGAAKDKFAWGPNAADLFDTSENPDVGTLKQTLKAVTAQGDNVFYCDGTVYTNTMPGETSVVRSNNGLLGTLDSIEKCRAFMGAQVFEDQHFRTGLGK